MNAADAATDAELLAAIPDDVAAFETFYRRYVRRVMGFAVTRCASADDAADVVAQTFVRLITAARRYDPARGQPAAFVLGVTANVIREVQRHGHRHQALLSKLAGRELLDDDDVDRIETAIDAAGLARRLPGALDDMPPAEQELLRLVAAGQSRQQAAAQLGISDGAARTRLSRARRRLHRHLAVHPEEDTRS